MGTLVQKRAEAQPALARAGSESLQGRGHRQAGPDLVVGAGSYEVAHQERGRTGERSITLFVREGSFAQRP